MNVQDALRLPCAQRRPPSSFPLPSPPPLSLSLFKTEDVESRFASAIYFGIVIMMGRGTRNDEGIQIEFYLYYFVHGRTGNGVQKNSGL